MKLKLSIAKLRIEYVNTLLEEKTLHPNPIAQFEKWFKEAVKAEVYEPNGMVLATISSAGRPASRTVLLKSFDNEGFVFFTHYLSRKGEHISLHPFGAVTFWWKEIFRQVNIEGAIVQASRELSDAYFQSRPKGAQMAAYASHQSAPLTSRFELEEAFARMKKKFRGKSIPRPKEWGGYILKPERIEFWQGGKSRLHDRILYVKTPQEWVISRLSP